MVKIKHYWVTITTISTSSKGFNTISEAFVPLTL